MMFKKLVVSALTTTMMASLLVFVVPPVLGSKNNNRKLQMNLTGDWQAVKEGVDGYPAGQMLEIALRRTQDDKLEMFKWRSEFIAMLGVQPGTEVEREWKTLSSWPPMTGAGTWTGMTLWDNMQSWHDMANMIFPSPVTPNWLATINMTLCHVKPLDDDLDFASLAQSGDEVLELGILAYPADGKEAFDTALENYLDGIETAGATGTYTFEFYNNGAINGPMTVYYNANGPANADGTEMWKVYMAVWPNQEQYDAAMTSESALLDALKAATVEDHSSIDLVTRSTSMVCCSGGQCLLDPEECNVRVLGMGDTWAPNCAQCPQPCLTGYDVVSNLSSKTCVEVGGTVVNAAATATNGDHAMKAASSGASSVMKVALSALMAVGGAAAALLLA